MNHSNPNESYNTKFNLIVDKFLAEHTNDISVIVPCSDPRNKSILDTITAKKPDIQYIEGILLKLSSDDIRAQINEMDSQFKKVYRDDFLSARSKLYTYLDKMDKDKNGVFTRLLIDSAKMRDTVDTTLKNNDDLITNHATKIIQKKIATRGKPEWQSNHCDPYSNGNHDSSRLCHEGLPGSNTSLPQRSPTPY